MIIIKRKKRPEKDSEFSKRLLMHETILIWFITIAFVVLAALCIVKQYNGQLPWLTASIACPWAAYGVSQAFYYRKAEKENTKGGIKYESVMHDKINKTE